jgi:hypothetical protein
MLLKDVTNFSIVNNQPIPGSEGIFIRSLNCSSDFGTVSVHLVVLMLPD